MATWTLKLRTLNGNLVRGLLLPVDLDQSTLDLKALDQVTRIQIAGLKDFRHVSVEDSAPIVTESAEHLTPQHNNGSKWQDFQGESHRYLLALDSLYREPGPLSLDMLREGEGYSALLLHAAWSGLVFDATPMGDAVPERDLRLGDTATTCTVEDGRATLTRNVRSLEPRQSPHGFALALSLSSDEIKQALDGEHSVRVDRWVGAAPLGPPTYSRLARLPFIPAGAPPVLETVDSLRPDELVGCQLHYAVTLIDGHLREVFSGMASALRERLDVPSAPADVSFHVTLEDLKAKEAILEFGWSGRDDAPERLGIMLLSESRGLDACGFYGGADDLALLAGLGALDLSVKQEHLENLKHLDAIQRDRLAGKWATTGLRPRFVWRATELQPTDSTANPPKRFRLSIPADNLEAVLPKSDGRRFHLCAVRIPRALENAVDLLAHAPTLRNSAVAPCAHTIGQRDAPVPVFQIEQVLDEPSETWLENQFSATIVAPTGGGTAHQSEFPSVTLRIIDTFSDAGADGAETRANASVPAGGFELWLRDRIGEEDPSPFQYVVTVQSLPPLVASYRPPPLNGATPWEALDHKTDVTLEMSPWPQQDKDQADGLKPLRLQFANTVERLLSDGKLRRAQPLRPPEDPVAGPAKVWERFFGSDDSQVTHGAIFSALAELGLAELLILPLTKVQEIATGRSQLEQLQQALESFTKSAKVCLWGMTDPQGHPFATIAVLQPMEAPDSIKAQAVWTEKIFQPATKVLMLGAMDLETRAFAEDRSFTYEWHGLQDRWCHELEWAVRRLDRYHQMRASLAANELEARRPRDNIKKKWRKLVRVPRTEAVADVIDITQDLSVDPSRLVFRYTDPPERRAAARNAFDAVRLGQLSVVHEMTRKLCPRYADLAAALPQGWQGPDTQDPWSHSFKVESDLEPLVESDRFDFGIVPPYYEYQLSARLQSERESGEWRTAKGRVESDILGLPRRPVIKVTRDGDNFEISVVLWCARLCHSTSVTDLGTLGDFLEEENNTRIDALPDLDVEYRIYLNMAPSASSPRLTPVFLATLTTETDGNVIAVTAKTLLDDCTIEPPTLPLRDSGTVSIVTRIPVTTRPVLAKVLRERAEEQNSPDTAFFFELVRGPRATGPHPYRGKL